jgi:sec-independent protein translocase protein TatA
MPNLGPWELGIVLVIILIIFGAGKLPEVARSLGQGVKEFKKEATTSVDSIPAGTTANASTTNGATTVPAGGSVVVEPADAGVRRELRADEV